MKHCLICNKPYPYFVDGSTPYCPYCYHKSLEHFEKNHGVGKDNYWSFNDLSYRSCIPRFNKKEILERI